MDDLIAVVVAIGFFVTAAAFILGLDQLGEQP